MNVGTLQASKAPRSSIQQFGEGLIVRCRKMFATLVFGGDVGGGEMERKM